MSLHDKIASAADTTAETVHIPQWDVDVEIRSMTARDRARMVKSSSSEEGVNFERLYPDLVILCTFDPADGTPVFTEDDRDMLLSKNAAAVELLASSAMRISGMGDKAVEEAGKGSSSPTLNGGSTSDSLSV